MGRHHRAMVSCGILYRNANRAPCGRRVRSRPGGWSIRPASRTTTTPPGPGGSHPPELATRCLIHGQHCRAVFTTTPVGNDFRLRTSVRAKGAGSERLRGQTHHPRGHAGPVLPGLRPGLPAGLRPGPAYPQLEDLNFYRPTAYQHIDVLFGDPGRKVIDWNLIETHYGTSCV
jgi:hypothetical protein